MNRCYLFSPVRSVIGRGASLEIGNIVAGIAQRVFVLGGRRALQAAERAVSALTSHGDPVTVRPFTGECTEPAIDRIVELAEGYGAIVGIGGGKEKPQMTKHMEAHTASCLAFLGCPERVRSHICATNMAESVDAGGRR